MSASESQLVRKQTMNWWHNFRVFPQHKPIVADSKGDLSKFLFAANPVYLEISQGKPKVGERWVTVFAFIWMGFAFLAFKLTSRAYYDLVSVDSEFTVGEALFWFVFMVIMDIGLLLALLTALRTFQTQLENVVRFDRKRQKVYVLKEKHELIDNYRSLWEFFDIPFEKRVFLELDWAALFPAIELQFSVYTPVCQGMFVEFAADAKKPTPRYLKRTDGALHKIYVGTPPGARSFSQEDPEALYKAGLPLEAVRRFMDEGYDASWIRPKRWRVVGRSDWRDIIDTEKDLSGEREKNSLGWIVFNTIATLFIIPCFAGWLAERFQKVPRFPEAVEKMHAEDLKKLKIDQYGDPINQNTTKPEQPANKPVGLWLKDKFLFVLYLFFAFLAFFAALGNMPFGRNSSGWTVQFVELLPLDKILGEDAIFATIVISFFILPPVFALIAVLIATLSRPLGEKLNPHRYWIPAKPLHDEHIKRQS